MRSLLHIECLFLHLGLQLLKQFPSSLENESFSQLDLVVLLSRPFLMSHLDRLLLLGQNLDMLFVVGFALRSSLRDTIKDRGLIGALELWTSIYVDDLRLIDCLVHLSHFRQVPLLILNSSLALVLVHCMSQSLKELLICREELLILSSRVEHAIFIDVALIVGLDSMVHIFTVDVV